MKLGHAVAHGLRVHVQLGRHGPPVPEVAKPRRERLDETVTGGGRLIVQRRQHPPAQRGQQARVAVDQDGVEVVLGEDRVLVEHTVALELGRRLRDQRAGRQMVQSHREAHDRASPA